jgi:diaminohydroxyphosphoribosylaminopyrimidine deaminase / 5-amino-6-(5-phosphoribosylamino)uracil reductase
MNQLNRKDNEYIRRCLELAARGAGAVSPNPMVGCVIVRNGRVVGEGYHRRFGGPHAEIEALRRAGSKARGATLYVNLEPCSHHGKTPPCVTAILRAGITRVVTSSPDPNPLVAGKGIRTLRRSGVKVTKGVLRRESEQLNEKFFTYMRTRLPFVGIKVAQTLDARVADYKGTSQWITSLAARKEAHLIRSEYDAILVGANTVLKDDPRLTVRHTSGRNPLRVVLDSKLLVNPGARVFHTKKAGTILFTTANAMSRRKSVVEKLSRQGVYVLGLENGTSLDLRLILRTLAALGVSSLLVEGGAATISQFLEQRLAKRLHLFAAPMMLGSGLQIVTLFPSRALRQSIFVRNATVRKIGPDFLIEGTLWYR